MSWSRCSEAFVAVLVVLSVAVVPAAAVSTSTDGVPEETRVGSDVTATYTFTELYSDYESWTLTGATELTDVTWTVRQLNQAGNQVSQESYDGASFNESVSIDDGTAEVVVEVTGTAPEVGEFSYEPAERYELAAFELVREGGTREAITNTEVHHYTSASQEARDAIERAETAVAATNNQEAQRSLDNAKEAYDGENFDLAVELATEAEERADRARSTQNRNRLILYGVGALLVVGLLVGGGLYYRSQQDSYDKLG
jgi:hypothetical protein